PWPGRRLSRHDRFEAPHFGGAAASPRRRFRHGGTGGAEDAHRPGYRRRDAGGDRYQHHGGGDHVAPPGHWRSDVLSRQPAGVERCNSARRERAVAGRIRVSCAPLPPDYRRNPRSTSESSYLPWSETTANDRTG